MTQQGINAKQTQKVSLNRCKKFRASLAFLFCVNFASLFRVGFAHIARVGFALLFSVSFALLPLIAVAAALDPLVPCGPESDKIDLVTGEPGASCEWSDFYVLAENIIDFLITYIALPLAAVFIAIGGAFIMTAAGSQERFQQGKKIITAAFIGLIIVLISWVIISQILQVLCGKEFTINPWEICGEPALEGTPAY